MNSTPIVVEGLKKEFTNRPSSNPRSWKELFSGGWRVGAGERIAALDDVAFEVRRGEVFGVIGANGAGKSTLLNLLGGIGAPTEGSIRVDGPIGALLDLGGGFQRDLTGRENAVMSGVVAGLLREEVIARMPDIVRFAELEEAIDLPVRTYSSGMTMRLAFSVAVHTGPAVLLVDEFLSVGDLAFQSKCLARIRELCEQGCAIVLVSHSMGQVREMCDRALWLRRGRAVALGSVEDVAEAYEAEMQAETLRRTPAAGSRELPDGQVLKTKENRYGSMEVEIVQVDVRPGTVVRSGNPMVVEIHFEAKHLVLSPNFAVTIRRNDGTVCLDATSSSAMVPMPDIEGPGLIRLDIERLDLGAGRYAMDIGVYEREWAYAFDFHWEAYPITIEGKTSNKGILAPPHAWKVCGANGASAKP